MIEVYEREYRVDVSELEIENVNGRISVSGYDGEAIKLRVEKSWGLLGSEPRVKVRKEGKSLKIFSKASKGINIGIAGSKVNFELLIPRRVTVRKAANVSGAIEVKGVEHCVKVGTVNGPIKVEAGRVESVKAVNGKVRVRTGKLLGDVKTVNGTIEVYAKDVEGHVHVGTVNGDITIHLDRGTNVRVEAETKNGAVVSEIEGLKVEDRGAPLGPRKAALLLGKGDNTLEVKTINGRISISEWPQTD
ncbi:DUF4097 family beta strand repeat-containing protein [Palaeococcus ferrophilus]|uniref:DUF4097 family beta strand repeat-containing protein n=1 Tax=Palaeococcus ferrophilus TaxID=83868 RepID=UPI00064F225B|nr:DUF4097 family beta strand repeat-containing protein [Palaeococcus ferrophilus]